MSVTPEIIIASVTLAVGAAAALVVWSAFDIGLNSLSRYRRAFTELSHFSLR
jgi:hypothetical protein